MVNPSTSEFLPTVNRASATPSRARVAAATSMSPSPRLNPAKPCPLTSSVMPIRASRMLAIKEGGILLLVSADSSIGVKRMDRAMMSPAFVALVSVTPIVSRAMVAARRVPSTIPGTVESLSRTLGRAKFTHSNISAAGTNRAHITAAADEAAARSCVAR